MAAVVEIETTLGAFSVELYAAHAPKTCANFKTLVERRYYDNVAFHRIVPGFCIQGGDPTGTGKGGASSFPGGGPFEDELHPALHHTGAGILSMANSGKNTNTSQFFITLAPSPSLDGKHTIFGRVCKGMGTIEKLSRVAVDADDRPKEEVKIITARVVSS
jgi:peptidyl-prolyl cis-trans isomerase-like 1